MKLSKLSRSSIEYNNIVTFYGKHVKGCGHEELNILSKYQKIHIQIDINKNEGHYKVEISNLNFTIKYGLKNVSERNCWLTVYWE